MQSNLRGVPVTTLGAVDKVLVYAVLCPLTLLGPQGMHDEAGLEAGFTGL